MFEDDKYGRFWDYRVLSWINTNPDEMPGRRVLSFCRVYYNFRPVLWPNPADGDVVAIDPDEGLYGYRAEDLMLALSRMQDALDKPALIKAEWEHLLMRPGRLLMVAGRPGEA